ncbi:MAG: type II toxin-antitoxin system HicA family toxin [Oscillospiraceae bacterium]|nr:type II toxin-antitoxin system HicA family toxin [Oscillospiraceae bacterium]
MSQINKLKERLKSNPKDFTFQEVETLLRQCGYSIISGGKTGGSRVTFADEKNDYIRMHRPHPGSILKPYQVRKLIKDLNVRGII